MEPCVVVGIHHFLEAIEEVAVPQVSVVQVI
jgi:hypothetical protein